MPAYVTGGAQYCAAALPHCVLLAGSNHSARPKRHVPSAPELRGQGMECQRVSPRRGAHTARDRLSCRTEQNRSDQSWSHPFRNGWETKALEFVKSITICWQRLEKEFQRAGVLIHSPTRGESRAIRFDIFICLII